MVDWSPASALNVFKLSDQPPTLKHKDLLLALCKEIIADGVVGKEEVHKLNAWLRENKAALSRWPGNVLAEHIVTILADGEVEDSEREQLLEVLKMLTGARPKPDQILKTAVQLPLDKPQPGVMFEEKGFCLIGRFLFGSLKKCQAAVISLGGEIHASPSPETDYVVIGSIGCGTLHLTSKWEKVDKAHSLKKSGYRCSIISEEHWSTAEMRQQTQEDARTSSAPPPVPDRMTTSGAAPPIIHSPLVNQATPRAGPKSNQPLCLPVDSDPFARELQIESSSRAGYYVVNLQTHTCTCPDFLERRAQFSPLDIRRACKHICAGIARRQLLNQSNPLTAAVITACAESGSGAPNEAQMRCLEIDGRPMLITFGEKDWVNVYARSRGPSNGSNFDRIEYNVVERRWSYGTSPRNSTEVKEFIHRAVVPAIRGAIKTVGTKKRSGCFSLVAIAVGCFVVYTALKLLLR